MRTPGGFCSWRPILGDRLARTQSWVSVRRPAGCCQMLVADRLSRTRVVTHRLRHYSLGVQPGRHIMSRTCSRLVCLFSVLALVAACGGGGAPKKAPQNAVVRIGLLLDLV